MAIPRAVQGQTFDIPRLGLGPDEALTQALFRTPALEVMRLVLRKGREMPAHSVAKTITLQCLEGCVAITAMGQTQDLHAGQILYLEGGQVHALKGLEDAALLLTILM